LKTLFILNEAPYGSEHTYNGLRLAGALARREGEEVRIFLMGDSSACAKGNQKVPSGYYKVEDMIGMVTRRAGQVGVCGTCMDARGIAETELIEGTHRSTLEELTIWTQWADKVLVF
jgi:uncharacterized protein involved in oxidation of intracellular sulfur